MYLIAPLNKEIGDLDHEGDVLHLLREFPDHEPTVGLGFNQEGYETPAALILHGDHVAQLRRSVDEVTGTSSEILTDEQYEARARAEFAS